MTPISTSDETSSSKPRVKWHIRAGYVVATIIGLYAIAFAGFSYEMHQPPQEFARLMTHTGPVPFVLFPFESMWKQARNGHLHIGDRAPDFTLPLLDHSAQVSPASFRGREPVVLIFGSYT